MKRLNMFAPFISGIATISLLLGCTSPDPAGRFDEFSAIKADEAPPEGVFCDASYQDIEGLYFVRVEHSVSPDNNIYMSLDVKKTGETYELTFQPRKVVKENKENVVYPTVTVGEPIVVQDVTLSGNGFMEVNLIGAVVDGEANSTTGSKIVADISLNIAACNEPGFLCGSGDLNLIEPFEVPGTTTIGATKVDAITDDSDTPSKCADDDNDGENP